MPDIEFSGFAYFGHLCVALMRLVSPNNNLGFAAFHRFQIFCEGRQGFRHMRVAQVAGGKASFVAVPVVNLGVYYYPCVLVSGKERFVALAISPVLATG